jgi:MFS superfamily sulfate permease-like transporter
MPLLQALWMHVTFLDLMLLSQMYSEKYGYPINASQELIAIGSSNIISGVFRGHPVGGPLSRSALSVSAGDSWCYVLLALAFVLAMVLL